MPPARRTSLSLVARTTSEILSRRNIVYNLRDVASSLRAIFIFMSHGPHHNVYGDSDRPTLTDRPSPPAVSHILDISLEYLKNPGPLVELASRASFHSDAINQYRLNACPIPEFIRHTCRARRLYYRAEICASEISMEMWAARVGVESNRARLSSWTAVFSDSVVCLLCRGRRSSLCFFMHATCALQIDPCLIPRSHRRGARPRPALDARHSSPGCEIPAASSYKRARTPPSPLISCGLQLRIN